MCAPKWIPVVRVLCLIASLWGLQVYRQRVALASQRYVLPSEDATGVLAVPDSQKHFYRAAAEILLDSHFRLHPTCVLWESLWISMCVQSLWFHCTVIIPSSFMYTAVGMWMCVDVYGHVHVCVWVGTLFGVCICIRLRLRGVAPRIGSRCSLRPYFRRVLSQQQHTVNWRPVSSTAVAYVSSQYIFAGTIFC